MFRIWWKNTSFVKYKSLEKHRFSNLFTIRMMNVQSSNLMLNNRNNSTPNICSILASIPLTTLGNSVINYNNVNNVWSSVSYSDRVWLTKHRPEPKSRNAAEKPPKPLNFSLEMLVPTKKRWRRLILTPILRLQTLQSLTQSLWLEVSHTLEYAIRWFRLCRFKSEWCGWWLYLRKRRSIRCTKS